MAVGLGIMLLLRQVLALEKNVRYSIVLLLGRYLKTSNI